jgi:hypothetical protein
MNSTFSRSAIFRDSTKNAGPKKYLPSKSLNRFGCCRVVPVPLLSLFTGYELETMVCGSPDIPLHLLKSVATYKGQFFLNLQVQVKAEINIQANYRNQLILYSTYPCLMFPVHK